MRRTEPAHAQSLTRSELISRHVPPLVQRPDADAPRSGPVRAVNGAFNAQGAAFFGAYLRGLGSPPPRDR